MSNSNKSVREEMERIYGKKCMCCQGIRKISPPKPRKGKYKGKSIASQLTYHHIYPKSLGGKATIENGAILCRSCHDYLEQLPPKERKKLNKELQEYKSQRCQVKFVEDLDIDYKVVAMEFGIEDLEHKKKYDRLEKKREDKELIDEYWER